MEFEHVHSFINPCPLVDILAKRADRSSQKADEGCEPERDVTSCRSNTYQSSYSARAAANDRKLALGTHVFNRYPTKDAEASSRIGVEGGEHGAHGTVERRAAVEAEPSKPDEHGSNEDECGVVGFSVDLVALVETLAEDKGVGERRPSGCDVDGTTSGEVKGRKVEQPTVSVTELADVRRFSDI